VRTGELFKLYVHTLALCLQVHNAHIAPHRLHREGKANIVQR